MVIHPIIYRHVLRGSTINSDGAKVYKNLIHMGFQHNVGGFLSVKDAFSETGYPAFYQ